jgi:hypothetical protein
MVTIHEHSLDTSLLPEGARILDIGCRGFLFANHFRVQGHTVWAVDIDDLERDDYWRCGISDYDGYCGVKKSSDPQATSIDRKADGVKCYTLKAFSEMVSIPFWDLIKIDVEGSEYEIIMSLEKAPATQLSIEFHLHTGSYGHYEVTLMEDKLKSLGYIPIKHEMTSEHGAGINFWDSLFILKQ